LTFDPERLDEMIRALSHRERRQLLVACRDGPRAAGELAGQSQLATATISEHLKVLRKTGLMNVEKDGRFWLYHTNVAVVAEGVAALHESLEAINGT
jgi:DNA-binding transcriptional ArsR family regulator